MINKLTTAALEELLDDPKTDDGMRLIIKAFLSAVNDWPTDVGCLEDFDAAIGVFINRPPALESIESALKTISYDTNAWEAESMSQVLPVFAYFDEGMSLGKIIEELKAKI